MNDYKIIAVLLWALAACSPPLQTAGGVTDTGNARVSATLLHFDGSRARNATVVVRPADFIASSPSATLGKTNILTKDTVTDDTGGLRIDSLAPGSYCIEVNDKASEAALLTVEIKAGLLDTILPADTLRPYSIVQGSATMPVSAAGKVFAAIYGLQRFVPLDSTGKFTFSNLPPGILRIHVFSTDSQFNVAETDTISALSGKTSEIPFIFWRHSKRLYLNTTQSGASVDANVINFPLLVRLTAADFSFSQAQAGGGDIRFTKSDFTALPYEIEQWDASSQTAEVWVKVDTVFGNDSTHFVNMYWGNPNAAGNSNSVAVFDTAQGFQAVWHLGQGPSAPALDATANHYNGTPSDTAPTSVGGVIGAAQEFDGAANYIEMKGTAASRLDFPQNGRYSLSAWIYIDTLDTNERFILGKGHEQYLIQSSLVPQDETWEFAEYQTAAWQISRAAPAVGQWKFLVGVRDGVNQYFYVDGSCVDSTILLYQQAGVARYTGNSFFIGKTPPLPAEHPNFFKGRIDEARVQSMALAADWIKLCYMNQKGPDALIKW